MRTSRVPSLDDTMPSQKTQIPKKKTHTHAHAEHRSVRSLAVLSCPPTGQLPPRRHAPQRDARRCVNCRRSVGNLASRRVRDAGSAGGTELGSSGTGDGGRRWAGEGGGAAVGRWHKGRRVRRASPGREVGAGAAAVGEVGGAGERGGEPAAQGREVAGWRHRGARVLTALPAWRWVAGDSTGGQAHSAGEGGGGQQLLLPVTASRRR
ncbi:hypothetical protein DAI22_02g370201 [Oryza sativa Japonica Group]|nr:hypothetical protein DAI22_02g370201 [Oryza sativa Japonica Group]